MTYEITPEGWFTSVNGFPVQVADATGLSNAGTYTDGHAIGVIFHETCGYQDNIIGSMEARGYATAPFSVGRDTDPTTGKCPIFQYLPVAVAGWHAFDASRRYFGIEHEDFPGGHPETLETDDQLHASAALSAALVNYTHDRHGYAIPLVHKPTAPPPNLPAGFRDHIDGTTADWNHNGHTDHLRVWSWTRYLNVVRAFVTGVTWVERFRFNGSVPRRWFVTKRHLNRWARHAEPGDAATVKKVRVRKSEK